jgi:hypothetical protein
MSQIENQDEKEQKKRACLSSTRSTLNHMKANEPINLSRDV